MSWTLIEKPKTIRVTQALAKEFAGMEQLPRDRPLSERRLMIYSRLLKEGRFRPVTWATCLCKETGSKYRVNGKHTSTLLSGLETIPEFYAVLEHYEADTLEDVALLYSTFDSKIQSRTSQEINLSFASVVPELKDLPSKIINLTISSIAYAYHGQTAWQLPAAERAEKLLDHIDFARWLHDVLGSPTRESRFMARTPVASAMFLSYGRARKEATRFWEAVRDQTGTKPNLPDRKIAKWLMQNNVATGRGADEEKPKSRKASSKEFFVRCLHAWNAWRKGIATDLKYYADAKVPTAV